MSEDEIFDLGYREGFKEAGIQLIKKLKNIICSIEKVFEKQNLN